MRHAKFLNDRLSRVRSRGFSLIELMVVIALLGILASIAAPSFRSVFENLRIRAAVDELNASIQVARVEAIRSRQQIVMLRTTGCTPNNWGCGWIIFQDTNRNNVQDPGELILKTTDPQTGISIADNAANPNVLSINNFGQALTPRTFTFSPTGNTSSPYCTRVAMSFAMRLQQTKGAAQCT